MSDLGETFADYHESRRQKKKENMSSSAQILQSRDITFESHNNGVHLIVTHNKKIADFWPSTGKYSIRGSNRYRRGVFNLLRDLEK